MHTLTAWKIRTYISEPERGPQVWTHQGAARDAVYANRRPRIVGRPRNRPGRDQSSALSTATETPRPHPRGSRNAAVDGWTRPNAEDRERGVVHPRFTRMRHQGPRREPTDPSIRRVRCRRLRRTRRDPQCRRFAPHRSRHLGHRESETHRAGEQVPHRHGSTGQFGVVHFGVDPSEDTPVGQLGDHPLDGVIQAAGTALRSADGEVLPLASPATQSRGRRRLTNRSGPPPSQLNSPSVAQCVAYDGCIHGEDASSESPHHAVVQPAAQEPAVPRIATFNEENADFQLVDGDHRDEELRQRKWRRPRRHTVVSFASPRLPELGDDVGVEQVHQPRSAGNAGSRESGISSSTSSMPAGTPRRSMTLRPREASRLSSRTSGARATAVPGR